MEIEMDGKIAAFWRRFLEKTGRGAGTPLYESFHFDLNEKAANQLLAMVLGGQKTATSSSALALGEQGKPPQVGSLSIVTDFAGNPACVIETTAITVIPYKDMTFDICRREGEDDCLESWQRTHTRYFFEEAALLGYAFTPDMPVIFEDFRVVYREG